MIIPKNVATVIAFSLLALTPNTFQFMLLPSLSMDRIIKANMVQYVRHSRAHVGNKLIEAILLAKSIRIVLNNS